VAELSHPIANRALVSYHRPELRKILPYLQVARHCWHSLKGEENGKPVKAMYLPQEAKERKTAYTARMLRSTYVPLFTDPIRAYAGLLNRYELVAAPPSLTDKLDNVDNNGTDIYSFTTQVDQMVLRDGGCYVMVDMPPSSDSERSMLDEMENDRNPYFHIIQRKDIIDWQVSSELGRQTLKRVVYRQMTQLPAPDNKGFVMDAVYHVFEPGRRTQYRVEKGKDGAWRNVPWGAPQQSGVDYIPIVWYGSSSLEFGMGDLIMQDVANLSIQHYQMRSDLVELIHKCSMPVPVIKGQMEDASGKVVQDLTIGPNSAIHVSPEGGDFKFAEAQGSSLDQHRAEIKHIEEMINQRTLDFLYGDSAKTATEAALKSAQVQSVISIIVNYKKSVYKRLMRMWASFTNELSSASAHIDINQSLFTRPMEASTIAQLVNLYVQGIWSRHRVIETLKNNGIGDPDLKVDEEVQRITEERNTELEFTKRKAEAENAGADKIPTPREQGMKNPELLRAMESKSRE